MKNYTVAQAAKKLKLKYWTLVKRIERDQKKPKIERKYNIKKFGGNWIITEEQLHEFN